MSDWTAGYVADVGYTYGYYGELNPLRVCLAFLNAGLAFPEMGAACELGFGQGVSVNLHAAASITKWVGTDFNPAQAGFAQELAAVSGAEARLYDQAFEEFCHRTDLPDFDYIGLHGIWSWISDDNRKVIVDFIRRKLKVGGVLYISYNTQPGWAAMIPMRDLLTEHTEIMGSAGQGIVSRIDDALAFADKLMATNPAYARANPFVADRVQKMKEHSRNYLAHEYFNRDWLPMPFSHMVQWLEPAKLNFACSAHFIDYIDAVNLAPDQQALLKDIPDPIFRETVRDFCINRQFRKDYWVKGARMLKPADKVRAFRNQRVILVQSREAVSLKVVGSLCEGNLQPDIYNPLLDILADHQPKSLYEIELALQKEGIPLNKIVQAIIILAGGGVVLSAHDPEIVSQLRDQTDKINLELCTRSKNDADISYLASPLIGGGVHVSRVQQLFLLAYFEGKTVPAELAAYAWAIFASQGERLIHENAPLATSEENLAVLTTQAKLFVETQLPILKALGIA